MASFHCSVKIGAKGSGGSHSEYLTRESRYSKEKSSRYEDFDSSGHGNMPSWAERNPKDFWNAADQYERANGSVYREIVVALPRELDPEQRRELVADFIAQEIGEGHAYQWAIHNPKGALDGGEQPHAHIMYNERIQDGIERDPAHYFKRANKKDPEKGGCVKASGGKSPAELKAELAITRERWANVQNKHLEKYGHVDRVTHLSLKGQGIKRQPERHLGARRVKRMATTEISALLERRVAEGRLERENKMVDLIDLSGDIAKAKNDKVQLEKVVIAGKNDILVMFEQYKKEEQRKAQELKIQKERIEIERLKAEQEKVFQANLERERAVEKSLREKPQELEMVYRPRNRTGPGMRR